MQLIFLAYIVFECHHNIQNQPIFTTVLSPSSFRHITTIRKHQHFCEILKYIFFLIFFKTVSRIAKHSTDTPSIDFHSYSQELVYMCSCHKFLRLPSFSHKSSDTSVSHGICPPQPPTT